MLNNKFLNPIMRVSGGYLDGLLDLINFLPGGEMIEIGSYTGESAVLFLNKFNKIYCIDPWIENYPESSWAGKNMISVEMAFDEKMKGLNFDKIKLKSIDAVGLFKEKSVDFVYIDGCHVYDSVKTDITLYLSKVKPGGYIGGHDYFHEHVNKNLKNYHPGVRRAVDEILGPPDKLFSDASWIKQLKE